MMKVWLSILCIFVSLNLCFAGRPLSTDDAETVEKGHWELELGFSFQKQIEKDFDEDAGEYYKNVYKNTNLELSVKYGVLENFDLGFLVPYVFIDKNLEKDEEGFEDLTLQAKYRILNQDKFPFSYALGLAFKTQSADEDKGLGTGQNEFEVTNIFSKSIDKLALHLNLGYNFLTKRKGQDDTFIYSLAFEFPLIEDKLNLVGEFRGETNFDGNFERNPAGILLGFNYSINNSIYF